MVIREHQNIPNSTNSVKIHHQSFQQIQELPVFEPFLVHFLNFGSINHSSGKSGSVTINFIWEHLKNNSDQTGRKHQDRKKDMLDKQTLFYRTFPATARLLPSSKKITQQMILNISKSINTSPYPSHSPLQQTKKDSILQKMIRLC